MPCPSNVTLSGEPTVTLTSSSKILFASAELAGVAAVLAEDLASLHGLALKPTAGTAGGPGDILLVLGPPPQTPAPPPPLPPPAPPTPPVCNTSTKTKLDNKAYADGDGPRTVADADSCCDLCAKTAGCANWAFQVDPKVLANPILVWGPSFGPGWG